MQPDITLDFIPKLPEGTFHKEIDSFQILTHPKKPVWAIVNSFGLKLLELSNGKNTIRTIVSVIKSQYDISQDTAERDITSFFASIAKTGILKDETEQPIVKPAAIKSVFLHLTDKCNLSCKHCYANNMSAGGAELTDQELISFLDRFYSSGGKALVLSGGEPLLRKNIKDIFNINPAAHFTLLTNATLIDDACASFLAQFNIAIQVSIDGSTAAVHDSIRGTGSFQEAITGVEHLKQRGLLNKINLCTTIMRQNISDLPNIFPLARKLGIPFVRFLPLRRKGNARDNWQDIQGSVTSADYEHFYAYVFDTVMPQYPDIDIRCGLSGYILDPKKMMDDGHWCPIGRNIVVDTRGNVYPCSLLIEDKFKIGNINEHCMDEIQSHPVLRDLLEARITRKNSIKKCMNCMWKNFCQASCMGSIYEQKNTIFDTDDFCNFRIKLFERGVIKLAHNKTSSKPHTPSGDASAECF
jgi:radical SAM protein with 4Fe4S-binding SPASM domain